MGSQNITNENKRQRAEYIESMLVELRSISMQSDFAMLSYLIEVAILEAHDINEGKREVKQKASKASPKKNNLSAEELAAIYMLSNAN